LWGEYIARSKDVEKGAAGEDRGAAAKGGVYSLPSTPDALPVGYSGEMAAAYIRVHLVSFGPLKSALAEGGEWRELSVGATVGALVERLKADGTISEAALASAAMAVNQSYVTLGHELEDGDEVAILPPVSGGAEATLPVALVREPIDAEAIVRTIKAGADGAVCVFDGIVRDNTRGRQTLHLDYEAYEEMALRQMGVLRADAIAQHGVRDVAIVHRLGRLMVGETSVLIVVASAHRGAAFEACRWVIDTLKKTVPIWKKEQFADGAVWADGEPFPAGLAGVDR
jgi:molybdopterin synthase catalytic subunit/molybdopterin converting factor small subunit